MNSDPSNISTGKLLFLLQSQNEQLRKTSLALTVLLAFLAQKNGRNFFEDFGVLPINGKVLLSPLKFLLNQKVKTMIPQGASTLTKALSFIKTQDFRSVQPDALLWEVPFDASELSGVQTKAPRILTLSEVSNAIELNSLELLPDPFCSFVGCFFERLDHQKTTKPKETENPKRNIEFSFVFDSHLSTTKSFRKSQPATANSPKASMTHRALKSNSKFRSIIPINLSILNQNSKTPRIRSTSLKREGALCIHCFKEPETRKEASGFKEENTESASKQTMETAATRHMGDSPSKKGSIVPFKKEKEAMSKVKGALSPKEKRTLSPKAKNNKKKEIEQKRKSIMTAKPFVKSPRLLLIGIGQEKTTENNRERPKNHKIDGESSLFSRRQSQPNQNERVPSKEMNVGKNKEQRDQVPKNTKKHESLFEGVRRSIQVDFGPSRGFPFGPKSPSNKNTRESNQKNEGMNSRESRISQRAEKLKISQENSSPKNMKSIQMIINQIRNRRSSYPDNYQENTPSNFQSNPNANSF